MNIGVAPIQRHGSWSVGLRAALMPHMHLSQECMKASKSMRCLTPPPPNFFAVSPLDLLGEQWPEKKSRLSED